MALVYYSCADNEFDSFDKSSVKSSKILEERSGNEIISSGEHKLIVLGDFRINPFEINNINAANQLLYGSEAMLIQPTHRYVKFEPSNQEHLAILNEWSFSTNIPLFDFPLEYEILEDGDYYVDPNVVDSVYTYQYGTVLINQTLPSVPFEIIEELSLDNSNLFLIAQSFYLTGNEDDINSYVLNGGLTESEFQEQNLFLLQQIR